jgi:hypothetical protein
MNDAPCDRTETLLRAERAGALPDALAAHAAACAECRAARAVESALRRAVVSDTLHPAADAPRLAPPEALLFRARRRAAAERAERATRPIAWARWAVVPAAILAAAWAWPAVPRGGAGFVAALIPGGPVPVAGLLLLAVVVTLGAALVVTDICAPES